MKKIVSVAALGLALAFGGAAVAGGDRGFERGMGNMAEMGGERRHMMKRMFSKLDLTDQQQAAIEALRDEAHESMQALRGEEGEREGFRDQMKSLVQAESFDEDAFREMLASKQDKQIERRVIHAKMKNGVWNLLTEEQQAKMTAMKERRGERRSMRRHGGYGGGENK